MNIFEQYGIKEVADVTFYQIGDNGVMGAPVLFLNSLKVSTIEETAEQTEAKGGKGNAPLIIWDYGKEINISIEDALYTPHSLALAHGGTFDTTNITGTATIISKSKYVTATATTAIPTGFTAYTPNGDSYAVVTATTGTGGFNLKYYVPGTTVAVTSLTAGTKYLVTWEESRLASTISVSADTFPGTYYVVGDTYSRNKKTGKDEYFQFVIPQAKMSTENTITLEAEGDPTVFNMNLRVLRPEDGVMMKLIQYSV